MKKHYLISRFLEGFKNSKIPSTIGIVVLALFLQSFNTIESSLEASFDEKSNEKIDEEQSEITGTVKDKSGNPLPGVTVSIVGKKVGTLTGFDGDYSIKGNKGDVLLFSYVGMKALKITIGNSTKINIVLEEDTSVLDEVVVVGYQSKQKVNLTGSVSVVKKEVLENRPTTNLSSLLPGLASGVTISRNNPGKIGGNNIGIRIGALATRNAGAVLVIVDGIAQDIDDVNPNDVESISLLKDAEAAIYGSRASEGVIVITTKKGGKPSFKASVSTTLSIPNIHPQKSTTIEYMNHVREGWANNNTTPLWNFGKVFKYIDDNNLTSDTAIRAGQFEHTTIGAFPDTPFMHLGGNSDWYDILYGTAFSKNYDASVSGSSEKTNYFASVSVVDQKSMLKYGNNSNKVYYTRLKYEYKHNKFIKVGANIALKAQNWVEPTDYNAVQNAAASRLSFDHAFTKEGRYLAWNAAPNFIGIAEQGGDVTRVSYNIQPQLYFVATPIENLNITGRFSKNLNVQRDRWLAKSFRTYNYEEQPYGLNRQPSQTEVGARNYFDQSFTGNLTATYKINLGDAHTIRALVGTSHEEFLYDNVRAWRKNLVYDGLTTLKLGDSEEQFNNDTQSEVSLKSVFANLSYSYKDRYVIEGTLRNDGSSRFAEGYKYSTFYSAGLAWNVTNEKFFENLNISSIDNLKFRFSWGELGNQASIGTYSFVSTLAVGTGALLGIPGSVSPAQTARLGSFPNLEATWELSEKTNYGLDADMFGNRLNIAANYFITETKNAFYTQDFPDVLGANAPQVNGANFKATGWNLAFNWADKVNENFSYNARFSISDANTKIISLPDAPVIKYGYNGFVEGQALGTVYGLSYDGFVKDDADLADYYSRVTSGISTQLRPGDAKYKDLDGDGVLEYREYKLDESGNPTSDSGDLIDLGDTEKHYEYNASLGATWKNFDFSVLLVGIGKQNVYDTTPANYDFPWVQPYKHYIDNVWRPTNTNANYPRANIVNGSFNRSVQVNNYRLSNASYMKLNNAYLAVKNIQLGYTIPNFLTQKLKIEKIKIYANASDLGYLINNMPSSYSPEQPFNANLTPYPTTVSFGINMNF